MSARIRATVFGSPWPIVLLALAGLALAVAHAPLAATMSVLVLVAACALVRAFGMREGLWYLLVASFPLRQALSVDIAGTASLFFGDVLLIGVFADTLYRKGLRGLWSQSATFKVAAAILALSVLSLYGSARAYWGVVSVLVIAQQIIVFYIARTIIRSGAEATRTLVAVIAGLIPVIAYGLYQATLPYGAELPGWSGSFTAYGATGEPHLRVFSTFGHPLRLSHYLSVCTGISLGLLQQRLRRGIGALVFFIGCSAIYCNFFTYSIGGVVATFSAFIAWMLVGSGRKRVVVLALAPIIAWFMLSHGALGRRTQHLLAGQSSSAAARLVTYRQSLDILRDHPIRGVGWGSIRSSLEGQYRITRSHVVAACSENYFLQRGLALGLPGLALYLIVFILFLRNVLHSRRGPPGRDRWPRAALLAGGVAFYVQAQFMPTTDASGNYLLWLMLALADSMYDRVARDAVAATKDGRVVEAVS